MGFASDKQGKRLVFLCWLLVAALYFYMSYDYIRVSWNGERFADYLTFVVQLAGNENRPAPEIKQLLVGKADDLGFALDTSQIKVSGSGSSLIVEVQYTVDVDIPVLRRGFYSKEFVHKAKFHRSF
jgi:hypothetical protein